MTTEPTIICPNCSTEIKLTESLAAPLIQTIRKEYEARISLKEAEVAKREADIRTQQKAVEDAQEAIEDQVAEKLKNEKAAIIAEEAKKAKLAVATDFEEKTKEVSELQAILKLRDEKLAAAQKAQVDLLRKHRELDDAKRELELTVEQRVQASLEDIRKQARQEAEEGLKLKVTEKETQISSMQRQIEELKRKAEQGSQQLQGEVMELELEVTLSTRFPLDSIEPVAKGEFGGDVLQRVIGPLGQMCGAILWESKRTKNWSDGWLSKLRNDQRTAKAEIAVLVSNALPKDIESFGNIDGVWITHPRYAVPLVIALRQSLIELAGTRKTQEGQETKMALVYKYLTGPKFRHRIEAIVEKFSDMQADLDRERKSMTRLWAKREAQIQGVIESTVGMYGDLQGIAGHALQEIEGLETPLLGSDAPDPEN
ncbi:hypothetical protein SAMN05421690_103916 [Nitrosomonas sp. Nm51]|uniref:DUF2130 domain-containing protein n=1 Tax=Nitrosomonas sp. Nm51 TaxID=133720 RepID=UPI0008CC97BA|nr:DUF2130 domain-containing protein [Nitrosomonas sp. Nm51]SER57357.1 hypothetical protein SAMN05421690_103916 [Nitrosomonas sp. Nm51]